MGSDAVATESVGGTIVRLNVLDAVVPDTSATWTVNAEVPAAEAVPEIVAPLSDSPAGREPA